MLRNRNETGPQQHQSRHEISRRDLIFNYNHSEHSMHSNDHKESMIPSIQSSWVPPNDRELIIRAKLKTGWSSRHVANSTCNSSKIPHSTSNSANTSDNSNSSMNSSTLISDLECLEIEQVLARAAKIEHKEINRINNLYDRWNTINKPLGNGKTNCLICNCNFGILEHSPRICADCIKSVCATCSIDTYSLENTKVTISLCKICSEYREFLKKSGAWFSKRLPSEDPKLRKECQSNTNCSPLKHATELHMSNHSLHKSASPILKDKHEHDKDNNQENPEMIRSISKISNYKKLTDYSDDDYIEESNENNNKYFETNNLKNNLNTEVGNNKTLIKDNEIDFNYMHTKKPAQQSNSSFNISKSLKEEFERESFMQTVKDTKVRPGKPSRALSNIGVPSENHKGSLTDLTNLPTRQSSLKSQISSSNDVMVSVSNLTNMKEQIAASKNLSKINLPVNATMRSGTSMVNLATAHISDDSAPLGSIQFTVEYIQSLLQLKIHLKSATSLASRDSNGLSDPYVKLHLLPGIAKATKLRSKTVYKNLNPIYNENLQYDGITLQDLDAKSLRLTVLDEDKFGYDFIGEYRLQLNSLLLDEINKFDVHLESKKELGDEEDLSNRGKINFALKYCKQQCCLYVKINRCRQLLPMDNGKTSDPFVEICLLPASLQKENKSRYKTNVKKKTLDPEFCEEFKFQNLDLKTLLSKTIEINVWDKDFGKNDYIGTVLLNQNRTGDELKHFFTMVKNTDIYHEQWHSLQNREQVAINNEKNSV